MSDLLQLVNPVISLAVDLVTPEESGGSSASTMTSNTAPSTTATSVTPTDSPTTTDLAMTYWDIANSLLSSNYPSTTLDGVSTLTFPSPVVIDGVTYTPSGMTTIPTSSAASASTLQSSSATLSTHGAGVSPSDTAAAAKDSQVSRVLGDKKLGIVLGCVIGFVLLVLLGLIFWCLRRRKDDTGSFFMRRRTPSIASSNIRSWLPNGRPSNYDTLRGDTYGNSAYVTAGASNPDAWEKSQPEMAVRPVMGEPRMSQHPAFAAVRRADSSRSTSEDNPFYTPAERPDAQLGYEHDIEQGPYDPHPVGLSQEGDARPRSSTSLQAAGDRPSTPFSPMEMMGFGARSHVPSQVERQDFAQQPEPVANPFTSPEDREDEDVISPILPAKNKERRYSPMVHYPSWSEVSEFDFHDEGRRVRNTNSADTHFTDSWHASRERLDGRYEMA